MSIGMHGVLHVYMVAVVADCIWKSNGWGLGVGDFSLLYNWLASHLVGSPFLALYSV